MSLKSTRSSANSRVTLYTAGPSAGTSTPQIKAEPSSPNIPSGSQQDQPPASNGQGHGASSQYTSLRRSTRSSTSTTPIKPDLALYTYTPVTPSPRKRVKVEHYPNAEDELKSILPSDDVGGTASPKTPKSAKKSLPLLRLEKAHPTPARWEEQYRLIERMRRGIIAPVDDMGCERPRTVGTVDAKTLRFHMLISLMLSSQTKDPVTSAAVTNLHLTLPSGLTAESLAAASVETVHECINKVGFWRRKTEYIQDAAKALLEQPGEARGDVPKTLEGLCALKGVGPKMAFLCLQCAWDINAGIGVDVHVHRITNRLKWHKPPTTNPEQTRLNLQSWLPPELHKPINPMMVGFGQVICLPVGPRCDICLLGKARICPSRVSNVKTEGRKEVVYTFTADGDGDGDGEDGEDGLVKIEDAAEAKVQVKYEDLEVGTGNVNGIPMGKAANVKVEELIQEPGMGEAGLIHVLDVVDGPVA